MNPPFLPALGRAARHRSFWIALALSSLILTRWTTAAPLPTAPAPAGLSGADWSAIQARLPLSLTQQAYVKASHIGSGTSPFGNWFGYSLDIDGDTLVVGSYGEDSAATGVNGDPTNANAPESGAAYVFVRMNGVWTQQAYLKASNTGLNDAFGISVAISGDTIVVGAMGEDSAATGVNGNQADNSASGAGAAYVFVRVNGVWTQQAYLKPSAPAFLPGGPPFDQSWAAFGQSVAIDGDSLVIGAYTESYRAIGVNGTVTGSSAQSGAAYVFDRTGAVWSQQAYLKASNPDPNDYFGGSVAISGDTIVVGAEDEDSLATGINGNQADNGGFLVGAAYVFVRANDLWGQQAYLKASNARSASAFARSLAIEGDSLLIGAPGESSAATGIDGDQTNTSASKAGAAYLFQRTAGAWTQQTYFKASNTGYGDLFGWNVALAGPTIAIGAVYEDSAATGINGDQNNDTGSQNESGAAYVFTYGGGAWSQQAYVKASNTGADDRFGWGLAVSGTTVAIGAYNEDSNATGINGDQTNNLGLNSGATYIFADTAAAPPTSTVPPPTTSVPSTATPAPTSTATVSATATASATAPPSTATVSATATASATAPPSTATVSATATAVATATLGAQQIFLPVVMR